MGGEQGLCQEEHIAPGSVLYSAVSVFRAGKGVWSMVRSKEHGSSKGWYRKSLLTASQAIRRGSAQSRSPP